MVWERKKFRKKKKKKKVWCKNRRYQNSSVSYGDWKVKTD